GLQLEILQEEVDEDGEGIAVNVPSCIVDGAGRNDPCVFQEGEGQITDHSHLPGCLRTAPSRRFHRVRTVDERKALMPPPGVPFQLISATAVMHLLQPADLECSSDCSDA